MCKQHMCSKNAPASTCEQKRSTSALFRGQLPQSPPEQQHSNSFATSTTKTTTIHLSVLTHETNEEADEEGKDGGSDDTDDDELEHVATFALLGQADLGHRLGTVRVVLGHVAVAHGPLLIAVIVLGEERVVVAGLQQIDVFVTHLSLQGPQGDVPQEAARHRHHRHWGGQ